MKALVYEGPSTMNIREVDIPVPEKGEVLIQVAYSGICGSELSGYLGHNSLRQAPLIFGHEFSGTVVEVGSEVTSQNLLSVGQRVTVNPLITCGKCGQCKRGRQQLCVRRQLLSATLPGSNADYIKVPACFVYVLPDSVSFEQGALVEPIACAVRIAELAALSPSESILIVGMGPIGQFVLQSMQVYGLKNIIVSDLNKDRLRMAEKLGAKTIDPKEINTPEAVRNLTSGYGVDVAIDAVGASITRHHCVDSVMPGGRVVFTGLHEADSVFPVNHMIRSEIQTVGSFAYSTINFETALQWVVEGRVDLHYGMVKAPLKEGAYWFERLTGNSGDVSKVLLFPPNE